MAMSRSNRLLENPSFFFFRGISKLPIAVALPQPGAVWPSDRAPRTYNECHLATGATFEGSTDICMCFRCSGRVPHISETDSHVQKR